MTQGNNIIKSIEIQELYQLVFTSIIFNNKFKRFLNDLAVVDRPFQDYDKIFGNKAIISKHRLKSLFI